MQDSITHETLKACTLADCPPGLFMFNGTMGFKSEYTTTLENPRRYQCDAYVVESGEYFHGGAKSTQDRAALIVIPLRTGQLVHAAPSVDLTERQSETLHKALLASYDSMVPPMPSGDEVEAVARAICGASGDVWRTGEGMRSPFAAQADRVNNHWRFKATAAITALDAHRGKQ